MSKKVSKKTPLELNKLTKKELIDIILGVQPPKISLDSLDKESLEVLKIQWNTWTKVRDTEFTWTAPIEATMNISLNYIDQFTKNFKPKDVYAYVETDVNAAMKEKIGSTIDTMVKVVNTELEKTRKVVIEVAKKAGMDPKKFWIYLEQKRGSEI